MAAKMTEDRFNNLREEFKKKNKIEILSDFSEYKNRKTKLKCRCLVCGLEQEKKLDKLLSGQGCSSRKCRIDRGIGTNLLSRADFIKRCDEHKDKFNMTALDDYEKYDGAHFKIRLVCNLCGVEQEKRFADLGVYGCNNPNCSSRAKSFRGTMSYEDYEDYRRDLAETQMVKILTNYDDIERFIDHVEIECLVCGYRGSKVLKSVVGGSMCPACSRRRVAEDNRLSEESFNAIKKTALEDMKLEILIDYEKYERVDDTVPVRCLVCGLEDDKIFNSIQRGYGCRACASNNNRITEEQYQKRNEDYKSRLNMNVLTDYCDFEGVNTLVDVECISCGRQYKKTYGNLSLGHACKYCSSTGPSKAESEIYDFVSSMFSDAIQGDRTILSGRELDVYVPSKKVGIEFNGLYWHSELHKEKKYHVNKWKDCKSSDVQLLQIFEDQWRDKREIVKSIISAKLGVVKERIYARKTEVKKYETKKEMQEICEFMDENHIDGHTRSKVAFGLLYDGKLVYAMTLRTPFTSAYMGSYEIARLAGKTNTVVVGGFSKVLKQAVLWLKENDIKSLLTYADLKLGTGNVYLKNGFSHIGDSLGEYWYTDTVYRYNRYRYRAKDGLTEKQVAKNNSVYRIYGVGSARFVLDI